MTAQTAAELVVAAVPMPTEAEQDAAALDYAETALSEAWAVLRRIAAGEPEPRRIAADMLEAHGHEQVPDPAAPAPGGEPATYDLDEVAAEFGVDLNDEGGEPATGDQLREEIAREAARHVGRMDDRTGSEPPIVWHIVCECGWDGGPVEVGRGLSPDDHHRIRLHLADAVLALPAVARLLDADARDFCPAVDRPVWGDGSQSHIRCELPAGHDGEHIGDEGSWSW